MEPSPRSERWLSRIKNNPLIATLLVLAFLATTIATFTDAVRKISALLPEWGRVDVTGRYRSDLLKDVRTRVDFHYLFDIKADGGRVYGTAQRHMPSCEGRQASGVCTGHGAVVPLLDGTRDAKSLAFSADWGELPGGAPWTYVKVKESFRGQAEKARIRFVQQDDRNDPPVEFVAMREE